MDIMYLRITDTSEIIKLMQTEKENRVVRLGFVSETGIFGHAKTSRKHESQLVGTESPFRKSEKLGGDDGQNDVEAKEPYEDPQIPPSMIE